MARNEQNWHDDEEHGVVSGQTMKPGAGNMAGEIISRGEQLLQIRSKNQLVVAIQRPRDEDVFATKLKSMAAQAGEDFFYSIPYKDHRMGCQDRRNCNCPSKPVEGPGVGLARAAAMYWTNCSVETRTSADNPDHWMVEATFVDFENNYTKTEEKRISKLKVTKGGKYTIARDKDLDVTYQQGASKVERDVILRALPKHIIDGAWELAKVSALMDKRPVQELVGRALRRFQENGVSPTQLTAYLGHSMDQPGWIQGATVALGTEPTNEQAQSFARERLAHMRGILTAIAGGQVTVEEIFNTGASEEQAKAPSDACAGAVTTQNIADASVALGGTRTVTTEAHGIPIERPEGLAGVELPGDHAAPTPDARAAMNQRPPFPPPAAPAAPGKRAW